MTVVLTAGFRTGSIAQLFTVLLIFVFVLIITAYTTKFVGGYQKMQGRNHNLEIIETVRISNTKCLQIVRAANKYIVIGVGKNEVTMLTELDESELIDFTADVSSNKESFTDIILKAKNKFRKDGNEQNNE